MQGTARRLVHGLFALLISTALLAPSTAESTSRELPTRAQVYVSAPEGEATAEPAAPSFFTAEHELVEVELRRIQDSRGYAVAYLRAVDEFAYFEDMVLDAFEAEGVPFELAAVPIIESGYKNVVQVVPKGYTDPDAVDNLPTGATMLRTIEATIDADGNVRLLEPVRLDHWARALFLIRLPGDEAVP